MITKSRYDLDDNSIRDGTPTPRERRGVPDHNRRGDDDVATYNIRESTRPENTGCGNQHGQTFTAETWHTSAVEAWAHALRLQTENERLRAEVEYLRDRLARGGGA